MQSAAYRFTMGPMAPPSGIGPLDPARERRLLAAAQAGDEGARAELLKAFAPLVGSMSRHYHGGDRELMQAGAAGLLRALERYDPELGTPFWAYASWWVRHAMQRLCSGADPPAVSPRTWCKSTASG